MSVRGRSIPPWRSLGSGCRCSASRPGSGWRCGNGADAACSPSACCGASSRHSRRRTSSCSSTRCSTTTGFCCRVWDWPWRPRRYRLSRLSARQTWCVALGITVGLGAVTWQSNRVWRDPVSLNTHLRRFEPHHPKILHNLAMALADQGNLEESIRLYQQAIAESDVYPHTHHNLARAYERLGRLDEAAEEYRKALAIDGAFHHSALALGQLELARGRDEAAEQMFRSALASYPYTAEAYLGLSQLALKRGDRAGARTALERGLRIVDDARLREALKELHPHDPRR